MSNTQRGAIPILALPLLLILLQDADIPSIPIGLRATVQAALSAVRQPLVNRVNSFNRKEALFSDKCGPGKIVSSLLQVCDNEYQLLTTERQKLLKDKAIFAAGLDSVVSVEIGRLLARDSVLAAGIERDVTAINRLGFARRAEDFAEWEQLATTAKTEFEAEVELAVTDAIAAKAQDKLLTTFKGFNRTKANEWIAALAKEDPRPDAFIAAIRRLARVQSKAELVSDAELILNTIHGISGVRGKTRSVALADLFQDVVCQMSPPPLDKRCDILKAELRVTVASLYNNAARQVASNEIDRLTTVTEGELHGLRKLNELMASRVRERVDIRLKLKSLNRASVDVFVPPGHGRSAH